MVKRLIACLLTLTLVFTSVNLYDVQAKKKIKLNKTQVLVRMGSPVKLKVKNTKKKVKWKSSNKKVATVSKKGVVKGKDDGNCVITAKVGKKKLKCKVAVANKVAKVTSAKTMATVAKKIKEKGTYDSSEGCYRYIQKFISNNTVTITKLKYYPKSNHLEIELMIDEETLVISFHVGDKRRCTFSYDESHYQYSVKGIWDVNKYNDGASALSFTNTNIPEYYHNEAKRILYPYLENSIYYFDLIMKKLNTKIYSESFGFNYPKSNYFQ